VTNPDPIPPHLGPVGTAFWAQLERDFAATEAASLRVLVRACELEELIAECRERIAADGLVQSNGRAHPLAATLRDATRTQASILRAVARAAATHEGRK